MAGILILADFCFTTTFLCRFRDIVAFWTQTNVNFFPVALIRNCRHRLFENRALKSAHALLVSSLLVSCAS
jgi:hypothetical protein